MRKYKLGVMFLLCVMVTIPFLALAQNAYGQQTYDGTHCHIEVKTPLELWYVNTGHGITECPILVKVYAPSWSSWPYWVVADKLTIDVWAQDYTWYTYADWMSLADFNVMAEGLGTTYTVTGSAGISGQFGGKTWNIGADIGYSWTATTTELLTDTITTSKYSQSYYEHLGQVVVSNNAGYGTTQENWAVLLRLGFPNSYGPSLQGHQYNFKVVVTVEWGSLWWPFGFLTRTPETHTLVVGDGTPTEDSQMYLLPAQSYASTLS